jgi:PhnB protein
MPDLVPYLAFDGNCADAMRFYERVLEARLETMLRFADSPMAAQVPQEFWQRIMHARLALPGGASLYAGDAMGQMPYQGMHGVSLTLNYGTVAEANKIFERLADGGKVTMAMAPTFWAKSFGMVTDRFGTHWIVNGVLQPVEGEAPPK